MLSILFSQIDSPIHHHSVHCDGVLRSGLPQQDRKQGLATSGQSNVANVSES